jgi:hypothetical protein
MSRGATLAPDAAMALGIASTAMPFARTPEDEAERWLRVLRLHGEAGIALQALGVSEGALPVSGDGGPPVSSHGADNEPSAPAGRGDDAASRDSVTAVAQQAVRLAEQRGADGVCTRDLLVAVIRIYGADFDRVLRAHGTDRDEVLERLAV